MANTEVPHGVDLRGLSAWAKAVESAGTTQFSCVHPSPDPLVVLGMLAVATDDATLTVMASLLRDRPALLVAKQLTAVDRLSRGRLVIQNDDSEVVEAAKREVSGGYRPTPFHGHLSVHG